MDMAFQLGIVTAVWAFAGTVILINLHLATVIADWLRAQWLKL